MFEAGSNGSLEHQIILAQQTMRKTMEEWAKHLPIRQDDQVDRPIW